MITLYTISIHTQYNKQYLIGRGTLSCAPSGTVPPVYAVDRAAIFAEMSPTLHPLDSTNVAVF